jgi:hypothetical protein
VVLAQLGEQTAALGAGELPVVAGKEAGTNELAFWYA